MNKDNATIRSVAESSGVYSAQPPYFLQETIAVPFFLNH